MADVIIRVSMDKLSKIDLARMTTDAVSRALNRAASRIREYAKTIVPVRTGRLRDSVVVSPTLKSILIGWDPVDPVNAYHYAKVVDEGRAGGTIIRAKGAYPMHFWYKGKEVFTYKVTQGAMDAERFSDHMRIVAPEFVRESIIQELGAISP